MKPSTAKGFGKKGWVILILTFFSILMNAMIIYDSLNVTLLPQTGLGWAEPRHPVRFLHHRRLDQRTGRHRVRLALRQEEL